MIDKILKQMERIMCEHIIPLLDSKWVRVISAAKSKYNFFVVLSDVTQQSTTQIFVDDVIYVNITTQ